MENVYATRRRCVACKVGRKFFVGALVFWCVCVCVVAYSVACCFSVLSFSGINRNVGGEEGRTEDGGRVVFRICFMRASWRGWREVCCAGLLVV